jgi:hypothetical protein
MAALPADLLQPPPELPAIPAAQGSDGKRSIDGRQALIGIASLYDVAGEIRSQLIALIAAERARRKAVEGEVE